MRGQPLSVKRLSAFAVVLVVVGCAAPPATSREDSRAGESRRFEAAWEFVADVDTARATDGMVSTTDRVASEVGAEILRRGGNAFDAVVATHFALAVVNPEAGNIGGGGFLVLHTASGEMAALDFRETAPLAATRDMYLDDTGQPGDGSRVGHLASGVPGSVAGMWELHQRYGTRPWTELLQPAIALADGIVVHERLATSLQTYEERLRTHSTTADTFLIDGRAPRVGERLAQPALAATLRRIADGGPDEFYAGRTAQLVVEEMQRGEGLISLEDLDRYEAVWRAPIAVSYRDHTIVSMPPPSSGGVVMAEIFNLLEGYDVSTLEYLSAEHVHLLAEVFKRGFVDRNAYLGDPDFIDVPVEELVSDTYAATRRAEISLTDAAPADQVEPGLGPFADNEPRVGESPETTHYSVVDGMGNAVAVTTTLNSLYGNVVTVAGAGFLLNNEMDDFTVAPGVPNQFGVIQGDGNSVGPGKRMLSSMTPTIVVGPEGGVRLVTGSPGGPTIITTVIQLVSNVIDFGMELADATRAPRVHHQHLPDTLYYERNGLSDQTVSSLRAMGHVVEERSGFQGDAQSILVNETGELVGAPDPRRGGAATGVVRPQDVVQ